jgi:hypothetical protein
MSDTVQTTLLKTARQKQMKAKHVTTKAQPSQYQQLQLSHLLVFSAEYESFTNGIGSKLSEIQAEWLKQTQWKITFSSEKHAESY